MTHQASEMTRFYASDMARRVEMHSPQFGLNNYLTHQQFHEVSTFRTLLSIINLFAHMQFSPHRAISGSRSRPQNNEKRANSFLRLRVLHRHQWSIEFYYT